MVNEFNTIIPIIPPRPTVRRIASTTLDIESPKASDMGNRIDIGCVEGSSIRGGEGATIKNAGVLNVFDNSPKRDICDNFVDLPLVLLVPRKHPPLLQRASLTPLEKLLMESFTIMF